MVEHHLTFLALLLLIVHVVSEYKQWSFQQVLRMPEAGSSYGKSPSALFGRGFVTLISGYADSSPGSVYVHTTDDGYLQSDGKVSWTLHAQLVPKDPLLSATHPKGSFGRWICQAPQTLVISSPYHASVSAESGAVYIFNGTLRHWTQIQKLYPSESSLNEHFGKIMKLENDRLLISADGYLSDRGASYVYDRDPKTLQWSRQGKLVGRDTAAGSKFGRTLSLSGDTAVMGALNDDFGDVRSGSAYLFQRVSGQWSQQQKLVSVDLEFAFRPLMDKKYIDTRPKRFGYSVAHDTDTLLVGLETLTNFSIRNRESVYVFKHGSDSYANSWSLQQKLFMSNESGGEFIRTTDVSIQDETLIATVGGPGVSASYLFKAYSGSWTQQQRLESPLLDYTDDNTNFTVPSLHGGTLSFNGNQNTILMTQLHEKSCLRIYMSDQFLDGWDIGVLTVRAPDTTEDRFHPHCDQVNPFYVRYCPYQPTDEGSYIIKVFSAIKARFFWELSWQVMVESTGQWYKGDYASKMIFHFDADSRQFSFQRGENLIDMLAPCYRCTTVETMSWKAIQSAGAASFLKLVVIGAPYFISDTLGFSLFSSGRVCYDVVDYQCYISIPEGIYTLRLGHGIFSGEAGAQQIPANAPVASWTSCGITGTAQQQLIFQIANSVCTPIQVRTFYSRCSFNTTILSTKYGTFPNYAKNVYSFSDSRVSADGSITNGVAPALELLPELKKFKDKRKAGKATDSGNNAVNVNEEDGERNGDGDGKETTTVKEEKEGVKRIRTLTAESRDSFQPLNSFMPRDGKDSAKDSHLML